MTTITTKTCGRCGGTGKHSYNLLHGDVCYGCGGQGVVPVAPKGQKKIKPTADLKTAQVGDIVLHAKVLYRIERITWIAYELRGWEGRNQMLQATRLVDEKRFRLYRAVPGESGTGGLSVITNPDGSQNYRLVFSDYKPPAELIGQETNVTRVFLTDEEKQEAIRFWTEMGHDPALFIDNER